jgi:hypothetical protein
VTRRERRSRGGWSDFAPQRLTAYRRAEELLTRDAPAALRAEVMIGLAWTEASAGDPVHSMLLLAEAEALVPEPNAVAGSNAS